ncbi:hypothetical protein A0H81_07185 [Grifola frondosa]|uniref:Uncharacterized protein n=1 Tax=Grifola frondosa TaxID=5627 RepID=A0A1C7M7X2_GRIFR|nr:hypothetical protein A0H81_07185 [Grifola frondosa]
MMQLTTHMETTYSPLTVMVPRKPQESDVATFEYLRRRPAECDWISRATSHKRVRIELRLLIFDVNVYAKLDMYVVEKHERCCPPHPRDRRYYRGETTPLRS